jgi:chromosome segregation ATPase
MVKKSEPPTPLLGAAEAFDTELGRFGRLADSARKGKLDSQRSLQRAAEALKEVADSEELLQQHAQVLMSALAAARDLQQTQAEAVRARATEIQTRTEVYADLMRRFQALGEDAVDLNARGQQLAGKTRSAAEMAADPDLASGLDDLQQRMSDVSERAQALATAAHEADFEDVSRQADSLRQQLLSARNKIALLRSNLAAATVTSTTTPRLRH